MRLVGILFIVVAACGGGQGGGGGARIAIQRTVTQTCTKAFECMSSFPPDAGFEFGELFGTSEQQCIATLSNVFDADAVEDSVSAGRILFDPNDANVCLNATAGLSCDQFWGDFTGETTVPRPPECETAFIGTVETGGVCMVDLDCAGPENFCDDRTMTCIP
jgi:hypothetical protein